MSFFEDSPADRVDAVHVPRSLLPRTIAQMAMQLQEVVYVDPDCLASHPETNELFITADYAYTDDAYEYHHQEDGTGGQVGVAHYELMGSTGNVLKGFIVDARYVDAGTVPIMTERYYEDNRDTLVNPLGLIYTDDEQRPRYMSTHREETLGAADDLRRTVDAAYTAALLKEQDEDDQNAEAADSETSETTHSALQVAEEQPAHKEQQ